MSFVVSDLDIRKLSKRESMVFISKQIPESKDLSSIITDSRGLSLSPTPLYRPKVGYHTINRFEQMMKNIQPLSIEIKKRNGLVNLEESD
jgi:hypothetical protein